MQVKIEKNKRYSLVKCCVVASGLCLGSLLVIYAVCGVLPGDNCNFIKGDALVQYVPLIKMFLRHLFDGDSLIYSFDCGMGMPTTALYSFYCLSPFNFLFLLFNDINLAYFVVFCMKLLSAAAAMAYLLYKNRSLNVFSCAVLSCAYAMNAFALTFNYGIIFLDMMILMPLLIHYLSVFVKTGRSCMLCVLYAISFIVHFYSAYMTGVFSFVVYLCLAAETYGKDFILWKKSLIRFAICIFLAILMAAPVLLPTAVELFSHFGKDNSRLDELFLLPGDFLLSFFPGICEKAYNSRPQIYCGILPVFLAALYFVKKSLSLREKLFSFLPLLFLILCCLIKPLYLLMHAFDAPDGYSFRFSWLISFWVIYLAAVALDSERQEDISVKYVISVALSMLVLYFILILLQGGVSDKGTVPVNSTAAVVSVLFTTVYLVLWMAKKKNSCMNTLLMGSLILEIGVSRILFGNDSEMDVTQNPEYYKIWNEQADIALHLIDESEEQNPSLFYRIHYLNGPTDNLSMLRGYHGIGWFLSIENEKLRSFLHKAGYATSSRVAEDYGSTESMRMLFSQKYSVECASSDGEHPEQFTVKQNRLTLPPAYMVSERICSWRSETLDPFAFQNSLVEALSGCDICLWEKRDDPYMIETEGMDWIFDAGKVLLKTKEDEGEKRTRIVMDNMDVDALYAYFATKETINDFESPLLMSNMDIGGMTNKPLLSMPRIVPMGVNEDGDQEIYINMMKKYKEVEVYGIYFAKFNREKLGLLYEKLLPGGVELYSVREGEWKGRVNATSEMPVLLTTIPWDEGWELYVDGEKADLIPLLDDAFLGARLGAGIHDIHLVFQNRWIERGVILGAIGIMLFGIEIICEKKRNVSV